MAWEENEQTSLMLTLRWTDGNQDQRRPNEDRKENRWQDMLQRRAEGEPRSGNKHNKRQWENRIFKVKVRASSKRTRELATTLV